MFSRRLFVETLRPCVGAPLVKTIEHATAVDSSVGTSRIELNRLTNASHGDRSVARWVPAVRVIQSRFVETALTRNSKGQFWDR